MKPSLTDALSSAGAGVRVPLSVLLSPVASVRSESLTGQFASCLDHINCKIHS